MEESKEKLKQLENEIRSKMKLIANLDTTIKEKEGKEKHMQDLVASKRREYEDLERKIKSLKEGDE